ncbi:MAG: hypothetical protein ABSG55_04800 [Dehalococcoidia bacterium]|jgi:hypothetical protein
MPSTVNRPAKRFYLIPLTAFLGLALVGGFVAVGCGGSGGSDSKAQAIVQKFVEAGQSPDTQSQVMLGKVPDDLPADLPAYPGASLLGSVVTTGAGGLKDDSVLRETGDSVNDVYAFYEQAFDTPPWQIEASTSRGKISALQFANTGDPTMAGTLVIQPESGGGSVIYTSLQTTPAQTPTSEPFKPDPSKPLPSGWPSQIPIYPNANVADTAWSRSNGSVQWQVSLLAVATPKDIIDYYQTQLSNAAFTVTNQPDQSGVSSLFFQNNLTSPPWSGTVTAQTFAQDPTYAQAVIQLQIGSGTPQPAPQPSGTATP